MRFRSLMLALAAVFAFSALAASSAVAAEGEWEHFTGEFKYTSHSPAAFIATSAVTNLVDGSITLSCNESTISGTAAASGTSNANNAVLGLLEMASWDKGAEECTGPAQFKFKVLTELLALHWKLHILWRLKAEPKLHFLGLLLKIDATIENNECKFLVDGSVPVLVRVIHPTNLLAFRLGPAVNSNNVNETNNLLISKLTEVGLIGCAGVKEGDKPVFEGEYLGNEGLEGVTLE